MSAEDDEDEQEPTRASPTALAETGVVEITPAAWSDSDEIDDIDPYEDPVRRNWLISGAIFAATAAVADSRQEGRSSSSVRNEARHPLRRARC